MAGRVELKKVVEKMNLKSLTPDVDVTDKRIEIPDINRPARFMVINLSISLASLL